MENIVKIERMEINSQEITLKFTDEPDEHTLDLVHTSFKWSRSIGAWQGKVTGDSLIVLGMILNNFQIKP